MVANAAGLVTMRLTMRITMWFTKRITIRITIQITMRSAGGNPLWVPVPGSPR